MFEDRKAVSVLFASTLSFTICFAAWMLNGVLVTYLVEAKIFEWTNSQVGWLIGIPVLTGSILRLPVGLLTDRFGGRTIFIGLLLLSSFFMWTLSLANSYGQFLLTSLGFGISGASFAVGIAYTSLWFKKEHQGTALGIFGAGNAGSALTSLGAPSLLLVLTQHGADPEGWRRLPWIYSLVLLATAVFFYFLTYPRKVESTGKTLRAQLAPLSNLRVWRFCLYYFYVFGGFVALAQWLIPYYVNVYSMSLVTAGLLASIFSLPSGVIRALGGWMSDHYGARRVMYWVFTICLVCSVLLIFPRMDVYTPGPGVQAKYGGKVTSVSPDEVVVDGERKYAVQAAREPVKQETETMVLPASRSWQEPVVEVGSVVKKKQLLAKGVTHIYFQANVWIFTFLVFAVGIMMGIGKAAVYKHIPTYFPADVGVVGGIVGVVGGLGGFMCPILFGYLLEDTGIWTTCWVFFVILIATCLGWMHWVIQKMMHETEPSLMRRFEKQ